MSTFPLEESSPASSWLTMFASFNCSLCQCCSLRNHSSCLARHESSFLRCSVLSLACCALKSSIWSKPSWFCCFKAFIFSSISLRRVVASSLRRVHSLCCCLYSSSLAFCSRSISSRWSNAFCTLSSNSLCCASSASNWVSRFSNSPSLASRSRRTALNSWLNLSLECAELSSSCLLIDWIFCSSATFSFITAARSWTQTRLASNASASRFRFCSSSSRLCRCCRSSSAANFVNATTGLMFGSSVKCLLIISVKSVCSICWGISTSSLGSKSSFFESFRGPMASCNFTFLSSISSMILDRRMTTSICDGVFNGGNTGRTENTPLVICFFDRVFDVVSIEHLRRSNIKLRDRLQYT